MASLEKVTIDFRPKSEYTVDFDEVCSTFDRHVRDSNEDMNVSDNNL